jgi:hypothetical protein
MPDEMLPESWIFTRAATTEFRHQLQKARTNLESLALRLAAAEADVSVDILDEVERRHVLQAASLLFSHLDADAAVREQKSRRDVFLSYKSEDRPFAEDVRRKLKKKTLEVFLDQASIQPGSDWQDALFDALRQSRVLLFLVTHNSLQSDWCRQEAFAALALKKRVICALRNVSPRDLPVPLNRFQAVEVQTDSQFKKLIQTIAAICSEPTAE